MASSPHTTTTSSPASHDRTLSHRQPLLDPQPVQVAPYLTHVIAHHGQLTLIPPQNAGRIRKSKSSKKKRQPSPRDDPEPRFTTAVPPSSSRKLHPASAQVRTRKHAVSSPSPTTPTTHARFDPIPDDQSIPDYPPPSFEDAIASPHVPPHLVAIPSVQNLVQSSSSIDSRGHPLHISHVSSPSSAPNLSSAAPTDASSSPLPPSANTLVDQSQSPQDSQGHIRQHPYTSSAPSQSSLTVLSSSTTRNVSPVMSQMSLHRPMDHTPSLSTTTLLSPTVTVSTALSDMPLLHPPRTRNMQPSPFALAGSRHPAASSIHLTSPSTTTFLTPSNAARVLPALSHVTLDPPQPSLRGPSPEPDHDSLEEPESPLVEPLSPLSPPASPSVHAHYRGSLSTVDDLVEELSLEPYQRWSADRRLGLSLEQRVQREFERRNTSEAREAFGISSRSPLAQDLSHSSTPPSSPSPSAHARRCSHCGSLRPRECGDTQSLNEHSSDDEGDLLDHEDEDEDDFSAARRASPLPFARSGRSPYLHPAPKMHGRARFHSHSPEPGSPASPLSPSVSFFKMPSAWASSVTLSLANALAPHKGSSASSSALSSGQASIPGASSTAGSVLKRKESFGVKKLFGSLKGKEREREQREREYAALPPPSASTSSSESSTTESVDGWEVVSGGDSPGGRSSTSTSTNTSNSINISTASSSESPYPSPARSAHDPDAPSPTAESPRTAAAFLNRPVRHRPPPLPLESPPTPLSPAHAPASPAFLHASAPSPTAARPYLPEKSPLRLIASANHLRQTQAHAHAQAQAVGSPVSASSPHVPGSPRTLRGSPSVVWKPSPPAGAAQTSPVQRSPLSQRMYQQSPGQTSQVHLQQSVAQTPTCPHAKTRPPPPPPLPSQPQSQSQGQLLAQPPTPSPVGPRAPSSLAPRPSSPALAMLPSGTSAPETPSLPIAQIHRRREVTPPPPSHRRVMLACDTAALAHTHTHTHTHNNTHAQAAYSGVQEGGDMGTSVGVVGEPGSVPGSLSIEQLMARTAEGRDGGSVVPGKTRDQHSPVRTPTTPSRLPQPQPQGITTSRPATPLTASSTPTTPTFNSTVATVASMALPPNPGQSQHYRGRPLPQLPPNAEAELMPPKRIQDGTPVNRALETTGAADGVPPPPSPTFASPPPSLPASAVLPAPVGSSVPPAVSSPLPLQMERSDSGDSVLEDAGAAADGPRPEFLPITDLDLLASRVVEAPRDGRNYENLLLISEIMGPAAPAVSPAPALAPCSTEKATVPHIGSVEVERRRVLKDGRVKLKLSLVGVPVDRCGVCLSQFRGAERGALTPVCRHAFHEACLRRWLRSAGVCPICRMALSMDD